MHGLDALQISVADIRLISRPLSTSLTTPNATLRSSISSFASLASMARNVITTLFLFTKSDIKTILIPITIFAVLSQPSAKPEGLAASMCWIWTHLLQFCVSNQSVHPAEDLRNKPWRPICSKRIAMEHAQILRWALLPLCLIQSYALGVPWQGLSLSLAFVVHNEFGLGDHWFFRTLCNVWGYISFNAGATGVVSDTGDSLDNPILLAIAVNGLIILTTIHAQDFYDEIGDRLQGRKTLPIVWPEASRTLMLVMTLTWSLGLLSISPVNYLYATAFFYLGALVGMRFYFQRDIVSDTSSYLYYNTWLTIAQVIHTPVVLQLLA